jgi:hypothetical protein
VQRWGAAVGPPCSAAAARCTAVRGLGPVALGLDFIFSEYIQFVSIQKFVYDSFELGTKFGWKGFNLY